MERYLKPVESLLTQEAKTSSVAGEMHGPGFVILSICFMLLESLQGFRDGEGQHREKSKRLFVHALGCMSKQHDLNLNEEQCEEVYSKGRCALLHAAGTEGIIVGRTGQAIEPDKTGDGFKINRTKFFELVKSEFRDYAEKLRNPIEVDLRKNFREKMNFIAGAKKI